MNDHNLDDLIIDNIDPKNSKTKSFLTIIALAIVVLIVAIILTKIILKDPNEKVVLQEDATELISPELTLQNTTPKAPEKVESIKETLALEKKEQKKVAAPVAKTKPAVKMPKKETEVVKITKEFSQEQAVDLKKEKAAKLAAEKKVQEEKALKENLAREKELEAKRLAEAKAKEEAAKKVAVSNGYFIQVGSFTQTPSSHFLSVIKNSGFNYQITAPSSAGTKKLLIGPYATRTEVDTALVRVRDRINKSAFVVKK